MSVVVAFVFFGAPVHGDESARHLVILETMTAPIVQQFTEAFLREFDRSDSGQGQPVRINRLNGEGSEADLTRYLHELIERDKPDVVVTVATLASQVGQRVLKGSDTPVLFMCVTDPVGAGLVETMGQPPRGWITGKAHVVAADVKIDLVMKALSSRPEPKKPVRMGFIHTDYPADLADLHRLRSAAEAHGEIEFVAHQIRYRPISTHKAHMLDGVRHAVRQLSGQVDYFWAPRGVLAVLPEYGAIIQAETSKPLLVGATEDSVRRGALLHITGDPGSQGRDLARITREVLSGVSPGEIPVTLPRRVEFALNVATALRMKLPIPSELLQLAGDRVYPR